VINRAAARAERESSADRPGQALARTCGRRGAAAWADAGIPVVTVPAGAGKAAARRARTVSAPSSH